MVIVYTRMYNLCVGYKINKPSCNIPTNWESSLGEGGEFLWPIKWGEGRSIELNPRNGTVHAM